MHKKSITNIFFPHIVTTFLLLANFTSLHASHIQGADLSYTYIGNNQYRFIINLYRDCTSTVYLTSNVTVTSTLTGSSGQCNQSSSSGPISSMLTLISGPTEVSQLCPSELGNSNCSGGTQPGTQRYVFERIMTLSFANCGTNQNWRVGFSFAARNNSITNLQNPGATDLYIEANIRQSAGLGSNSSPVFNVLPVPYVCIGQPVIYTHGAFDAEGDSLVFSSITPLAAGGAPALYNAGFSSSNPLTTSGGFTVNPSSGQLSYTPSQIQVAVITLLVEEYRNNVLISSTMRDLQIIVRNCTGINANPPNSTQAQNLSGASLAGNVIQVCVGSSVSFQFTASDPDAGTILSVTSDQNTSIPGSTLTYSGGGNSVTGNFNWTPTAADVGPNSFSVTISDNACPISAISAVSFVIQVNNCSNPCPSVATTAPSPLCNNTTLNLTPLQQTNQAGTWSITSAPAGSNPATISGSTLNAIGRDPGSYTIRFTLSTAPPAGCATFSQQTLTILPSPGATISPASATVCPGGSITLTASGGGTYTWSNSSNTAGITVSPLINTTYTVTVTGSNGCSATASRTVNVGTAPPAAISPATATVCPGGTATLTASGGTTYAWSNGSNTAAITVSPLINTTYTVTVLDANNCSATASRTVNVGTAPPAAISPATATVCPGGTATLTASGGTTYAWSNGSNTAAITVSPLINTTYTVTVLDANNCSATASRTVNVGTAPPAAISPATATVCPGASATLTASGGTSYAWSNGSNTAAITVSPLINTTYTVTVLDANNCSATAARTVNVNQAPAASISPASISICSGNSTTLTASGGTTYAWSNGSNTAAITVSPIINTTYTVTVLDANNCSATTARNVNVNPTPTASISPSSISICSGNSTTLTASGGTTYAWSNGSNTAAITVSPLINTTYTVTVLDANNCSATASASVSLQNPVSFSVNLTNPSCGINNGSIAVTVPAGQPSTFSWSPNANTGNSPNATGLGAGIYQLSVTQNGCTRDTTLSLNSGSSLTASLTNPISPTCAGNDGAITFSLSGGTAPYTLDIDTGGTPFSITLPIAISQTFNNLPAGNIQVSVTDANGCFASAAEMLIAPTNCCSLAIADVLLTSPGCGNADGSIALSVANASAAVTFDCIGCNWVPNATGATANGLAPGTYAITITDPATVNCQIDTTIILNSTNGPAINNVQVVQETCSGTGDGGITLNVSGGTAPLSYSWSVNANTGNTATATSLSSGTYGYTITDASGCAINGTSVVGVGICCNLQTTASSVGTTCGLANGSVTIDVISGGTPVYAYSINGQSPQNSNQFSNLSAGTYTLLTSDANGCQDTLTITVASSNATLSVSVISSNDPSCFGFSDGSITANVNGQSGNVNWIWSNGGSSPTNSSLAAGNYTVTVTDDDNCTASASAILTNPLPLSVDLGDDTAICNGLPYTLIAPTGFSSYLWSTGETTASIALSSGGLYSISVTDNNGCTANDQITVSTGSGAFLDAGPDIETYSGSSVNLSPVFSSSTTGLFDWSPSTGLSCGDCFSPTASPETSTTYVLTFTDINGCVVSDSLTVSIIPVPIIFFPNAFSPNGDGNNDEFKAIGSAPIYFQLLIFNRWGEKVFETQNINEGWDGIYMGENQPIGVYVYTATITFANKSTRSLTGSITLVR